MNENNNTSFSPYPKVEKKISEENLLNEELRERIKQLEFLQIGNYKKAELILILLGHKPATELSLYKYNSSKEEVAEVLKQVGLSFSEKKIDVENENIVANFSVARDDKTMKELLNSAANSTHKEYGRLMGFPKTATEAFMDDELLLADKDYPNMKEIIFDFKLSKKGWKEEVELLQKWSADVEKYSKETYTNLVPGEANKKLEQFEKIKAPDELLLFMQKNIEYGFIDKKDNKIHSPKFIGWGKGDMPEQYLQSPEELLESGHGTCWEQTELEKRWFEKNGYDSKTFLFKIGDKVSKENPAHAMLAYQNDDKWYWFENSFGDENGNHKYENLDELIKDVKKKVVLTARNNGATKEDLEGCSIYEYKTSSSDCSNQDEFISKVKEEQ